MTRVTLTTIVAFLSVSLSANGFAQTLPAAEPESVGLSTDRLSRVDALFESYIADGRMAWKHFGNIGSIDPIRVRPSTTLTY